MEIAFALGVIIAFLIGMCVSGGINVNINVNKNEGVATSVDEDGEPVYNKSIDNMTAEQKEYFRKNSGQYRM